MREIFTPRKAFKPFEYPEVLQYRQAIKKSRWDVEEFNLERDATDFHNHLSKVDKEIIKRALLCISQIEVSVKTFYSKLGDHIPKPEFNAVGITIGENEVVHEEAYSELLQVLGLNQDFELALQNPVIAGRVDYLTKYLKNSAENAKQAYTLNLLLFSILIENVSLFSQFAIIKTFCKKKNLLKEIDSIIDATMKEETIHAKFGMYLINLIKEEYPDWFNEDFYNKVKRACIKAFDAELNIIDWIFVEKSEIIDKKVIIEFLKYRIQLGLEEIGFKDQLFNIDKDLLSELDWMEESLYAYIRNDFFDTQSTNYTKHHKSFSSNDLF